MSGNSRRTSWRKCLPPFFEVSRRRPPDLPRAAAATRFSEGNTAVDEGDIDRLHPLVKHSSIHQSVPLTFMPVSFVLQYIKHIRTHLVPKT